MEKLWRSYGFHSSVRESLAVLARRMEADRRPALDRRLQVVLVRGEEDGIFVDVGRERRCALLLELSSRRLVRIGEPAGGGNACRIVDGIDTVFARESIRDDFELQLPNGAEQQRVADIRFEYLYRAFLAELAQSFLQLLCFERIPRTRNREELRREIRNALEVKRFAFGQRVADLQLAVIVNADDVAGDCIRTRHALV